MEAIQKAITGHKEVDVRPDTVDPKIFDALQRFYAAFNAKDLDLMQENWSQDDVIAMDNPLGGIKRSWEEIEAVYRRIFSGKAVVYVEFYDYTIVTFEGGLCAIGRERGHVETDAERLELAIRTSRIYKEVKGTYRQVHHHGSIEDPALLSRYQTLVK